jgi:hypothetical protein
MVPRTRWLKLHALSGATRKQTSGTALDSGACVEVINGSTGFTIMDKYETVLSQ